MVQSVSRWQAYITPLKNLILPVKMQEARKDDFQDTTYPESEVLKQEDRVVLRISTSLPGTFES